MTDKTVKSHYQTSYLENRILKIQKTMKRHPRFMPLEGGIDNRNKEDRHCNAMQWKSQVKLKRAQGGCLGTESRRKT